MDSAAENITEKVKADWASYIAELEEKIIDAVKNEISLPKAALSKSQREAAISSAWEQYIAPLIASELQIYSEKITEEIKDCRVHPAPVGRGQAGRTDDNVWEG